VDPGQIPPERLAHLGVKRVFDPEKLKWAREIYNRAYRACLLVGTRWAGGFLVPLQALPGLEAELSSLRDEWEAKKGAFLVRYDEDLEAFLQEAGPWADMIRRAVLPRGVVEAKFRFGWMTLAVRPPEGLSEAAEQAMEEAAGRVADGLWAEVGDEAREIYERVVVNVLARPLAERKLRKSTVERVRRLVAKVQGFVFLDPRVAAFADRARQVLDAIPKGKGAEGLQVDALCALILEMKEGAPERYHNAVQKEAAAEPLALFPDGPAQEASAEEHRPVGAEEEEGCEPDPVPVAPSEDLLSSGEMDLFL
ncbi:MAG TPA: DUF3150 domain-containing protein, partial [Bryobacterales bacterium]|nr:DUF3150 domain-containing protein [Bryobacterales bacterium]